MGEIIQIPPKDGSYELLQQTQTQLAQMTVAMQTMAAMLRTTNEAMESLRRQVRLLEKVTPAQASALNAAIRARAAALCADYRCAGGEKAVAAAIRKAIRIQFGATTVRELPRCDYEVARRQVDMWEDYRTIKAIKGRCAKP